MPLRAMFPERKSSDRPLSEVYPQSLRPVCSAFRFPSISVPVLFTYPDNGIGRSFAFLAFLLPFQHKPAGLQGLIIPSQHSPLNIEDVEIGRYNEPPLNLNNAISGVDRVDLGAVLRP